MIYRLSLLLVVWGSSISLLGVILAAPGLNIPLDDWARTAPWSGVRFVDQGLEVQVDDQWWRLRSIEGVETSELFAHAKRAFGSRWEKRIVEDIVEVLVEAGVRPTRRVDLELENLDREQRVSKNVEMTRDNRERAKRTFGSEEKQVARVQRPHAKKPDRRYKFLASRIMGNSGQRELSTEAAARDLDQLEAHLFAEYPYLGLTDVDVKAALDTLRLGLKKGIALDEFGIQLVKFLALLGDGHTRLRGANRLYEETGFLPFILVEAQQGWIGVKEDRSGPAIADYPIITHIDGIKLVKWLQAASKYVAKGSPQFTRSNSARMLRWIQQVRRELGVKETSKIVVKARRLDGKSVTRTLELADRRPLHGVWPQEGSRLLGDQWGYLRIPSMSSNPDKLQRIDDHMSEFRDTRGLVIDVRGNRGGSRRILRRLAPYFLSEDHPAFVANVARVRSSQAGATVSGLSDRFLLPTDHFDGSTDEGKCVAALAARFAPKELLPLATSSAWHYLVLKREDNPAAYPYRKPVVVLCDNDGFSATDIFVGALECLPQVVVVGTATAGGSGRSRPLKLVESGLELQLSTMASYRPNGSLYDGVGVAPDIEVLPDAADLYGASDRMLEAAIKALKSNQQ